MREFQKGKQQTSVTNLKCDICGTKKDGVKEAGLPVAKAVFSTNKGQKEKMSLKPSGAFRKGQGSEV